MPKIIISVEDLSPTFYSQHRDPLEPPKFKHKIVPKPSGSPAVPIVHSPPRLEDRQEWKIPPCIFNWKNLKGYTIPLDKRLAADGRGLQEVQINDDFAKLSEALYVAELKAREAVYLRSKIQKQLMLKESDMKALKLRALAKKARSERTGLVPTSASAPIGKSSHDDDDIREEREQKLERDKIREKRRRERERVRRREANNAVMGKKSKLKRDRDHDVSEKLGLGMANTGAGKEGEAMYDQRLFNQDTGMELAKDMFGLDEFLTKVKRGKKAMDKIGGSGTMLLL